MSDPFSMPPPPPPNGSSSNSFSQANGGITPCSNGQRLGAALLDGLLFVVTLGIGWLIWDILLLSKATSPAKKMLGLRIVDIKTGAPATMQQMLLREVLGKYVLGSIASGITGLVSVVLILVTPSRQGVWDYIARTTVVSER
jgi:uncharacterized RDD family membrane protein YckC